MNLVFSNDGACGYSGSWSTITSARSFDDIFFETPKEATHKVRYSGGATAGLIIGEALVGGTSNATCILVARVIENNVDAGSSDDGWLWVRDIDGAFQAETLTGSLSSGTVDIYQAPIQILTLAHPKSCLITVEAADIRFSLDGSLAGTTALSANGILMSSGQSYVIRGEYNIKNFNAINAINGSGSILKYQLFY